MKQMQDKDGNPVFKEVFNPIIFITENKVFLSIAMRDQGYEIIVVDGSKEYSKAKHYAIDLEGVRYLGEVE